MELEIGDMEEKLATRRRRRKRQPRLIRIKTEVVVYTDKTATEVRAIADALREQLLGVSKAAIGVEHTSPGWCYKCTVSVAPKYYYGFSPQLFPAPE